MAKVAPRPITLQIKDLTLNSHEVMLNIH